MNILFYFIKYLLALTLNKDLLITNCEHRIKKFKFRLHKYKLLNYI